MKRQIFFGVNHKLSVFGSLYFVEILFCSWLEKRENDNGKRVNRENREEKERGCLLPEKEFSEFVCPVGSKLSWQQSQFQLFHSFLSYLTKLSA